MRFRPGAIFKAIEDYFRGPEPEAIPKRASGVPIEVQREINFLIGQFRQISRANLMKAQIAQDIERRPIRIILPHTPDRIPTMAGRK